MRLRCLFYSFHWSYICSSFGNNVSFEDCTALTLHRSITLARRARFCFSLPFCDHRQFRCVHHSGACSSSSSNESRCVSIFRRVQRTKGQLTKAKIVDSLRMFLCFGLLLCFSHIFRASAVSQKKVKEFEHSFRHLEQYTLIFSVTRLNSTFSPQLDRSRQLIQALRNA